VSRSVTFVHTADLHLAAPFKGLCADDPQIGAELAEATYAAFSAVVDTCIGREADFLVIAGDVYDGAERGLRAQWRFREQLCRLADAGIQVFIAHGNHDPLTDQVAEQELPEGVHVFGAKAVERYAVLRDGEVIAAVYGQSFGRSAETANLALGFRRSGDEPLAVGVLHANAGGNTDYDPYAPASLDDLRAAGMDYWALGHVHTYGVLCEDPWIVYPGNPQGLSPRGIGQRGCVVVHAENGQVTGVERVEAARVIWEQVTVQLQPVTSQATTAQPAIVQPTEAVAAQPAAMQPATAQAATIDGLRSMLGQECSRLRDQYGRPVIARFLLTGATPLHEVLLRPGVVGELLDDLRVEQSYIQPWVWIDRLRVETSSPLDLGSIRSGGGFATELVRIADELSKDPCALAQLVAEVTGPVEKALGLPVTAVSGYAHLPEHTHTPDTHTPDTHPSVHTHAVAHAHPPDHAHSLALAHARDLVLSRLLPGDGES